MRRSCETPVGQARAAFERGDELFQYAHDVESQDAVIVAMVGEHHHAQELRSVRDPQRGRRAKGGSS